MFIETFRHFFSGAKHSSHQKPVIFSVQLKITGDNNVLPSDFSVNHDFSFGFFFSQCQVFSA